VQRPFRSSTSTIAANSHMLELEVIMPVLTQGRYADACKTEAVRLVSESGRPVAQIAR
jgi:hypothetical protein